MSAKTNTDTAANTEEDLPPCPETPTDTFHLPVPHHISDVNTWGYADRNYYVFVVLSFLFGFFGLDHFYLRSFDTGTKKLIFNVLGLGIWYLWDILQISTEGAAVRQNGLNSPLDWIRGIGRGVFKPLPMEIKTKDKEDKEGKEGKEDSDKKPIHGGANKNAKVNEKINKNDKDAKANKVNEKANNKSDNKNDKKKEPEYAAPKSYLLYTFLAIFLGMFGADKFYIGQTKQGLAKLFSVFNIFLFLFGLLWVAWDAVHAFFMTGSVMKEGIAVPMPYSFFFKEPVEASKLFRVVEVKEEEEESSKSFSLSDWLPSLPTFGFHQFYMDFIVPLLQPTVGVGIQRGQQAVTVGTSAVGLASAALGTGPSSEQDLPLFNLWPTMSPQRPCKIPALPMCNVWPMPVVEHPCHCSHCRRPVAVAVAVA